jgi:hypothetical protein
VEEPPGRGADLVEELQGNCSLIAMHGVEKAEETGVRGCRARDIVRGEQCRSRAPIPRSLDGIGNNWRFAALIITLVMQMRITILLALALVLATPVAAGDDEKQFALELEKIDLRPRDPRTQARLARWNDDPMARVAMHMASEQARMLGGHQPGAGKPNAMVVSVRLQKGLAAALAVASSSSGVEFYERRMAVIRWPWETDGEAKPAMPLDEQLTVMLGERLESR